MGSTTSDLETHTDTPRLPTSMEMILKSCSTVPETVSNQSLLKPDRLPLMSSTQARLMSELNRPDSGTSLPQLDTLSLTLRLPSSLELKEKWLLTMLPESKLWLTSLPPELLLEKL